MSNEEIVVIPYPSENPEKYNEMPEGLSGYWWETEHTICVPFVENQNEGDGNFSKWLTSLELKGKTIFFPTVISARLVAILKRRGYIDAATEFSTRVVRSAAEKLTGNIRQGEN